MITPQRIACFIGSLLLASGCALMEASPPVRLRIVRVKALGDLKLREDPRWTQTVEGLVEAASDYFEREFGVRFVVDKIAPWPSVAGVTSTRLLLTRLKEEVPLKGRAGNYDLIIGFTGENVNIYVDGRARVDRIGNCHLGLGNYMVTSVSSPFLYPGPDSEIDWDVLALIHELGHILGAEHTNDSSSIMHHDFAYRTEFDQHNRDVILRNRLCPFGKG